MEGKDDEDDDVAILGFFCMGPEESLVVEARASCSVTHLPVPITQSKIRMNIKKWKLIKKNKDLDLGFVIVIVSVPKASV